MTLDDLANPENWKIVDAEGNEVKVTVVSSQGFTIRRDGIVEFFTEDADSREEWTEPLWRSSVREIYPDWVWELMDEALDPRNETPD